MNHIQKSKSARCASVPLIVVKSPDYEVFIKGINSEFGEKAPLALN
jgi:hypothetical protein